MRMPNVRETWNMAPSMPLRMTGLISPTQEGQMTLERPTPRPRMTRMAMMPPRLSREADTSAPMMVRRPVAKRENLKPMKPISVAPNSEPTMAPNSTEHGTHPPPQGDREDGSPNR